MTCIKLYYLSSRWNSENCVEQISFIFVYQTASFSFFTLMFWLFFFVNISEQNFLITEFFVTGMKLLRSFWYLKHSEKPKKIEQLEIPLLVSVLLCIPRDNNLWVKFFVFLLFDFLYANLNGAEENERISFIY